MALLGGALALNPPRPPDMALPRGAPLLNMDLPGAPPKRFSAPLEPVRMPQFPPDPELDPVRCIWCPCVGCCCGEGRSGSSPSLPKPTYFTSKSRANFIRGVSFATRKSPRTSFMYTLPAVRISMMRATMTSLKCNMSSDKIFKIFRISAACAADARGPPNVVMHFWKQAIIPL